MKTLRELMQEYALERYQEEIEEDRELFELLENNCKEVCKDDEDQHRWYTYWRHVYEVKHPHRATRYFALSIPEMKGEESSWSDIDFTLEIDNAWEVFPRQVVTTVYE